MIEKLPEFKTDATEPDARSINYVDPVEVVRLFNILGAKLNEIIDVVEVIMDHHPELFPTLRRPIAPSK